MNIYADGYGPPNELVGLDCIGVEPMPPPKLLEPNPEPGLELEPKGELPMLPPEDPNPLVEPNPLWEGDPGIPLDGVRPEPFAPGFNWLPATCAACAAWAASSCGL